MSRCSLFREKRPPNEPVLETPLGDAGQPSFCMDHNQSRMILNVTPSPQEIVVLSNSVKCCEADEEMYENLLVYSLIELQLEPLKIEK